MRYSMDREVAEAVAAGLVAQNVTARVYPSDRATYGCMVRVRSGTLRLSIYTAAEAPGVLSRLHANRVEPTAVEILEASHGYQEGEGPQGQGRPAPDPRNRGSDPLFRDE